MQITTTDPAPFVWTADSNSRQAAPAAGQAKTPEAERPNEPCPWCGSVKGEYLEVWPRCLDCGGN